MRIAKVGQELITTADGRFIGINLGYDNCVEHECGTHDLITRLNSDKSKITDNIAEITKNTLKARMLFSKIIKKEQAMINRWQNTPFEGYILCPNVPILIRKISIDNSELRKNGVNTILGDGNYTLIVMTDGYMINHFAENCLGNKRKFDESTFFNVSEYQNISNRGLMKSKASRGGVSDRALIHRNIMGATWGSDGVLILINRDYGDTIENGILQALKGGSLAIVPMEPRLFYNRGCCLIDVNTAYRG